MLNAKNRQRSARALPPGPRGYPFIGVLPQALSRPLETLTNAARQYGGVVRLGSHRPGGHVILISGPGPLKHVLQERYHAYNRHSSRIVRLFGDSYIPFGAGPQQCIGKHLAEMEICLTLAVIAQRYRLRLAPGTRVEPEPAATLRPRNGLPMTLHLRSPGAVRAPKRIDGATRV